MASLATDYTNLTRICEFARRLHQLRRLGGEDAIEREFNAVCRAIWGFTLDDFTDDDLSAEDHAWLVSSPRNPRSLSPPSRGTTSRTTSTAAASPTGGASRG